MKKLIVAIVLFFISTFAFAADPGGSFRFLWNEEPIKAVKGGTVSTKIMFEISEGYYIYSDKTDLEFITLEGIHIGKISYPKKEMMPDPLGGAPVGIYTSGQEIGVEMSVPEDIGDGTYTVSALLHYEGCSNKVCFRPVEELITWTIHIGVVGDVAPSDGGAGGMGGPISSWLDIVRGKTSETILSVELKWLYLIAFIGGILSSLTPCILPLIPVTMLIIGVGAERRWQANLGLSLMLVVGMSVTYAALGIAAAAMGWSLGFIFQSRLFIIFVVVFFFLMGLSLIGLYTLELPAGLRNALSKLGGRGPLGALLAGISMGLLATPCIGPIVAVLLVYAGSSGSLGVSFSLLAVYAFGLGVVIVLIGTWYGTMVGRLKKARVRWIKKLIGILLIITSLYYLHSLVPYTVLFRGADHPIKWQPSYGELLAPAGGKMPVKMVLFSAEWCPPCKLLKFFTLKSPEIVRLSEQFVNIEVDATHSTPEVDALVKKFDIKGWPTIIFISSEGIAIGDLTIFGGYVTVNELADRMKKALSSGSDPE